MDGFGSFTTASTPAIAAWSPVDFGASLVAWHDASDASTITQSSGAVSAWADKSGHLYHYIQSTAANKPAYSATGFQSNSPGITFDGVNDFMEAAGVTMGTTKFSAFVFGQYEATEVANDRLLAYQANGDANDFALASSACLFVENGAGNSLQGYRAGGALSTAPNVQQGGPLAVGVNYRFGSVWDGANHTFYLDNAIARPAVASTGSLVSPGTLRLCAFTDFAHNWKGQISEIIILNRDATAAERTLIDNWFLRHWSRILIADGDSIVWAPPGNVAGYTYLFLPNSNPPLFMSDIAVPGTAFNNISTDLVQRSAATTFARIPANKGGRQYVLYFSVSNNLCGNASGTADEKATQGVADWVAFAQSAKAAGYDKVVVGTVLSRTDGQADDIKRNLFNTKLKAAALNPANCIDAVADLASDPIMGVDAAPTVNAAYFADTVHPNTAGNTRLEPILRAAINGL